MDTYTLLRKKNYYCSKDPLNIDKEIWECEKGIFTKRIVLLKSNGSKRYVIVDAFIKVVYIIRKDETIDTNTNDIIKEFREDLIELRKGGEVW